MVFHWSSGILIIWIQCYKPFLWILQQQTGSSHKSHWMSLSSLGWTAGCDFQQGHQKSSQMSGKTKDSTSAPLFVGRTVSQRLSTSASLGSAIANFTFEDSVPTHFHNHWILFHCFKTDKVRRISSCWEVFFGSRKNLIVIHRLLQSEGTVIF